MTLTESMGEEAALGWFQELGCAVFPVSQLAPRKTAAQLRDAWRSGACGPAARGYSSAETGHFAGSHSHSAGHAADGAPEQGAECGGGEKQSLKKVQTLMAYL